MLCALPWGPHWSFPSPDADEERDQILTPAKCLRRPWDRATPCPASPRAYLTLSWSAACAATSLATGILKALQLT